VLEAAAGELAFGSDELTLEDAAELGLGSDELILEDAAA
jgi:hypothetical protein